MDQQLPINVLQFPRPTSSAPAPPSFGLGQAVMLKLGDRGPQVVELQKRLQAIGADPQGTDGIFGPNTERAVKQFKTAFALPNADSSVVDQATWDRLVLETPSVPAGPVVVAAPAGAWGKLMALPLWQKLLLGSGVLLVVGWGLSFTAKALSGVDGHCPRLKPPRDVGGEIIDVDYERAD